MRARWLAAVAAGLAIGAAAPAQLDAQSNADRVRQQRQQETRQNQQQRDRQQARQSQQRRDQARAQQQREAERLRREREQQARVIHSRRDDDRWDRRTSRDPWDIYGSRDSRGRRQGPAFCRSGEGHPVYGRQWCRQKGFELGRERHRDIWGDIVYRQPRRYDNRQLGRGALGDILGSVILGRFDAYGREFYPNRGSLNGRWLGDTRVNALQLFMGSTPIALLIDSNRDGRVDSVQLVR